MCQCSKKCSNCSDKSNKPPLTEQLPQATGKVTITEIDEKGNSRVIVEDQNIVTNGAYEAMMNFMAGTATSGSSVSYMQFGSNTPNSSVAQSDTALFTAIPQQFTPTITTGTGTATFAVTLTNTQLNGTVIAEAGLFDASSNMLAHIAFGASTKQSGYTWVVTWQLSFTIIL